MHGADFPYVSLAHLTMLDAHPLQLIDAAVAGGFNAIGLRIAPPVVGDPLVQVVGNEALIRELQQRLADNGLKVMDIEVFWLGPETRVENLEPVFEVAARLGTANVLAMGNDPDRARLIETFGAVAQLAAKHGMGTGLEFMPYLHTATLGQSVDVIKQVNLPGTGVVIDILHLIRSGGSAKELSVVAPELLMYAQLCDVRGSMPATLAELRHEARNGRFYPGEGDAPLMEILEAMPPGLPLAVEAPCANYLAYDVIQRGVYCGGATERFLKAYRKQQEGRTAHS